MTDVVIVRPVKRGNVRTYDEEYNKGFTDIWASEVDADFDQLYAAWNGLVEGLRTTVSPTPPISPNVGDMWWRNTDGNLFIFYDDGNSKQFVPAISTSMFVGSGLPTGDVPTTSDLTGTYPAPLIKPGIITGGAGGKLAFNTIVDANIAAVDWSKISNAPTTLPPSGPAGAGGGALSGTYPNPGVVYSQITGIPTSLPPSGAAGGDLAGSTYPDPVIKPGAITNAKVNDVAWGKITGAPTTYPPSGTAGGSLAGTYPSPSFAVGSTVYAIQGATGSGASISLNSEGIVQEITWTSRGGKWFCIAGLHGHIGIPSASPAVGATSQLRYDGTAGVGTDGFVLSVQSIGSLGISSGPVDITPFSISHTAFGNSATVGAHRIKMTAWLIGQQVASPAIDSSHMLIVEMA